MNLSEKELDFLYKTSIDYTLCEEDEPILSIDFDGMGDGFSKDGQYLQNRISKEAPYRKLKFDLKLRLCEEVGYPYFIVSYNEAKDISSNIHLTIIDGIIGQHLAHKWFKKEINERIQQLENQTIDNELGIDWYIQEIVSDTEIDASYEFNPIVIQTSRLFNDLFELKLVKGWSDKTLCYPELPHENIDFWTTHVQSDLVEERMKAMSDITRYGCKLVIDSIYGDIVEICWMNNIRDFGVSAITLIKEIAELLAYEKLYYMHCDKIRNLGNDQVAKSRTHPIR